MEEKLDKVDKRITEINTLVAEHVLDDKSLDVLKNEISELKKELSDIKEEIKKQKK
jgi:hypothetical protein